MASADGESRKSDNDLAGQTVRPVQPVSQRLFWAKLLLSIAIGAFGGWLFAYAALPLPWMLGSMSALLIAALLRAPVGIPQFARTPMVPLIGVLLGASFSPETLSHLYDWTATIAGLFLFSIVCAVAGSLYFHFVARTDPVTAYYAGMPGGLVEMILQGEEHGGDTRFITLAHAARIFVIVMMLPFLVQAFTAVNLGRTASFSPSLTEVPGADWVWLAAIAVVGALVGKLVRLPAALLVGPMLISAFVHLVGLTSFVPAIEVIICAQIVLGATIGCRFIDISPTLIGHIFLISGGYALILIVITLGTSLVLWRMTEFEFIPIVLAYSPGGLPEMSLIALSLQVEVAYVATHHILRVVIVTLGARPAFLLARRFW